MKYGQKLDWRPDPGNNSRHCRHAKAPFMQSACIQSAQRTNPPHPHTLTRTHTHTQPQPHTHTHTHTHAHTTTHTHTHTTTHTHLQAHLCIIAAHAITDHCPQRLPHRFLLHYTEAPVQLAVLLKVINVPVGAHCHTPVMNTCASFAEWCHSVCPHHHTGYNCWGGRYFGGGGIKETRV